MRGLSAAPIRPAWRPIACGDTADSRLAMCWHIREARPAIHQSVIENRMQLELFKDYKTVQISPKVSDGLPATDNQTSTELTAIEICAGAGGQALGLALAGFTHVALIEYEIEYCNVLKTNRPDWNVVCDDIHNFSGKQYYNKIDLLAGGVPCPPFSVAGKQLGEADERDLFPEAIRLISEINPRAVMIENVRGLLDSRFDKYRNSILNNIKELGYKVQIKLLNASDFGVPQLRPRVIIIAIRNDIKKEFCYPEAQPQLKLTVGEAIGDLMNANHWSGYSEWLEKANRIAPTVVGGSKKHGGPDLGPVRARKAWEAIGVDGLGIANTPPESDFVGNPRLTPRMLARIQGFPDTWNFGKKKTSACRMIGNAFPPPVAKAVGEKIKEVLQDEVTNS